MSESPFTCNFCDKPKNKGEDFIHRANLMQVCVCTDCVKNMTISLFEHLKNSSKQPEKQEEETLTEKKEDVEND